MNDRYDATIEDPMVPDANEFQHMALGYVEHRIRLMHILVFGFALYGASGVALIMQWLSRIGSAGAALLTDVGLAVLAGSFMAAVLFMLKPVRPSVAFALADESIRNDHKTSRTILVLAGIFTVATLMITWGPGTARTASILAAMWVAVLIACFSLRCGRYLRIHRNELYATHLAKRGRAPVNRTAVVRAVMPGPIVIDSAPPAFELQAFGYAGARARSWALILLSPMLACTLGALLLGTWVLGLSFETWIVPVMVSTAIALCSSLIGGVRLRLDRRGKASPARWYAYGLRRSAQVDRGTAIGLNAGAVAIFVSGAIAAPRAVDPGFMTVVLALSVGMASATPFMLKAGEILNRRRELYVSWLIRHGEVTLEDVRTLKPRNLVTEHL